MRAPAWFWLVCGLALLWEAAGVAAYLGQVYGDGAALSEAQRSLIRSTPAWVTGAYATAVFAGLAGAVSLLLKRRWAASLFILSLAAAVVQFGWVFTAGRAAELLGPSAAIFPVAIILVGVALVWLARRADRNGWLR
jgi:hypothetical protein